METKDTTEEKVNGALLGAIIVVIILVIGGVYLGKQKISTIKKDQNVVKENMTEYTEEVIQIPETEKETSVNTNIEIE